MNRTHSDPPFAAKAREDGDRTAQQPFGRDELRALQGALDEVKGLGSDVLELGRLGLDRAQAEARHGASKALSTLGLGLVGIAAATLSVWYVLEGLSGGLAVALGNSPWAGQLLAGVLGIATMAGGAWGVRERSRRKRIARLQEKYSDAVPFPQGRDQ